MTRGRRRPAAGARLSVAEGRGEAARCGAGPARASWAEEEEGKGGRRAGLVAAQAGKGAGRMREPGKRGRSWPGVGRLKRRGRIRPVSIFPFLFSFLFLFPRN